jgi:hypothetical protein
MRLTLSCQRKERTGQLRNTKEKFKGVEKKQKERDVGLAEKKLFAG